MMSFLHPVIIFTAWKATLRWTFHACLSQESMWGLILSGIRGGKKARGSIHIATWSASLNKTVIRWRFVCKEVLRGFDDNLKVGDWDWKVFWGCCVADSRPKLASPKLREVWWLSRHACWTKYDLHLRQCFPQDLALLLKAGRGWLLARSWCNQSELQTKEPWFEDPFATVVR